MTQESGPLPASSPSPAPALVPASPAPAAPAPVRVPDDPAPAAPGPSAGAAGSDGVFARRVTAVFSTRVVAFAVAFCTSVVLSLTLGPGGKGQYLAVIYVPGLLSALGVFGIPSAINYYSARGHDIRDLFRAGLATATVLSILLVAVVLAFLPLLEQSVFSAAPRQWLWLGLFTIPAALFASFSTSVLYGRQRTRTYSTLLVGQALATLATTLVLVAILGLGVPGAILASVLITWLFAARAIHAVVRLAASEPAGTRLAFRSLLGYGVKIVPASITGYFNYRIDVFILQAVLLGTFAYRSAQLGLYNMAFTMAELLFYIPDSVTLIFLPRVSGSTVEEANAALPRVARFTVLLTFVCGLALVPAAFVGVHVVLPQFVGCLPAFIVLLPGIVSMAMAKVMTSYISGRGRPGLVSIGASAALVINVVANLILIPMYGIVGASLASLISYTCQAAILLVAASRISHLSPLAIVVPGKTEFLVLWRLVPRVAGIVRTALAQRLRRRAAAHATTLEGPRP